MRRALAQPIVLAIGYFLVCNTPTLGQTTDPARVSEDSNNNACPSSRSSDHNRNSALEVTIADLNFDGDRHLAVGDQDQIAASLKLRTYSANLDEVTSEVLEKVKRGWQEHGYFKVQVRGKARVLTSSPVNQRIAVSTYVDEVQQYRLGGITFKNNRAVTRPDVLRSLFPLEDGDLFDVALVRKGLEALYFVYAELGYINFTSIPNTRISDDDQTILLDIDMDEGKQFYISKVDVIGRNAEVLNESFLGPGQIYNERLIRLFLGKYLSSAEVTNPNRQYRLLDERAGTVAITFDLRPCPIE